MDEKEADLGIKWEKMVKLTQGASKMVKLTQGASGHFSMFVSFHYSWGVVDSVVVFWFRI